MIFVSAIKGAGDTRFVLVTSICLAPIPAGLGYLGIRLRGWGLIEFWILVTTWIFALAVVYGIRFCQGKWRLMRVIEFVNEAED